MNIPYKYKGIIWGALLILVLPIVIWQYALQASVSKWLECRKLAARIEQLPSCETQKTQTESNVQEMLLSGVLLETVRQAAANNRVQVIAYEPLITHKQDLAAIHTAQLALTGSFTGLLRIVAQIEQLQPKCRLRSLVWQTATDRITRRPQLILTLYIQQLIIE